MKKEKYLILGIILVLCLTGCFNKNEKIYEDLTLEYLNNNYSNQNDTFTFINCGFDLFEGSHDRCYFKSEKYNEKITVYVTKEDNNYSFECNYFKLYMKKDAEKYFSDISRNYPEIEIKVRFGEISLSNASNTFAEYINSGNCYIDVYFISHSTLKGNDINTILNNIANNKIQGYFTFAITSDSNLLSDKTLDDILNNQSQMFLSKETYYIDKNFKITKK